MTNPIIAQLVSLAVAAAFGAATGYLASRLKRITTRDRAIEEGVKSILRHELMDDFDTYAVRGEPLTMERRREIDECYHAYAALGGNGTGKSVYERICALQIQM